jgi:RNA ligase (TIGR02306 family)
MERKLASIRRIKEISPIDGADKIEVVKVDGWQVVVGKDVGYKAGDLVIYCEIDSFLPIREEFEFLRKTSYRKMGGIEGFRLKTIRLRGVISQGLILPLSVLEGGGEMKIGISKQPHGDQLQLGPYDDALIIEEGTDVTEILGIVKFELPIPAQLSGKVKGNFPGFLRRSDESRIQNLAKEYQEWAISSKHQFYATEKIDGSSFTCYLKDGQFGVCSRNLELIETDDNSLWGTARKMGLEDKLVSYGKNVCLQGEIIGPGIQGNPYGLFETIILFYNVYLIDEGEYLGFKEFSETLEKMGLPSVPILEVPFEFPGEPNEDLIEAALKKAEGKSVLNEKTEREGLVIRSMDRSISFKIISNNFLLGEK